MTCAAPPEIYSFVVTAFTAGPVAGVPSVAQFEALINAHGGGGTIQIFDPGGSGQLPGPLADGTTYFADSAGWGGSNYVVGSGSTARVAVQTPCGTATQDINFTWQAVGGRPNATYSETVRAFQTGLGGEFGHSYPTPFPTGTEGIHLSPTWTVQVTCRTTGASVSGDRWWYQLGQKPWSNAYFAPAASFYNVGFYRNTGGPLPPSVAVDSAVPVCGASPPPPPPPPPLPPPRLVGWAPGGSPTNPPSQVAADEFVVGRPGECAPNSMLLFRVRGSGEKPGTDKLGGWTYAAGTALIAAGWRVRDMQADYPAPGVPLWPAALALLSRNPITAAAAFLDLKNYRDSVTKSWSSVRETLVAAYNRCPQRKILLAGYSLGGLVLRYVVPHLPVAVRRQVMVVDLVADPTEQGSVDNAMHHTGPYDLRWTREGIDTLAGRGLGFRRSFTQTAYPSDIVGRAYQYCKPYDIVCDANPVNVAAGVGEGARHGSYEWANIGRVAAAYADAHKPW